MNIKPLIASVLLGVFPFQSHAKGGGTNAVVYAAAAQGEVAKLKEYFAADPDLILLRDGLLRTAVLNGQREAAEFLLLKGADVNAKGFFDMTPLAHMAMYGTRSDEKCAGVAKALLARGAELDPVDQYGATPLLHAVEVKKPKLTRVLLESGANPARTYGKTYYTPLHYAIRSSDLEMTKLLLDFKAPTEIVDPDRSTPLSRAVESKNYKVVRLLLEHGAKISPPRTLPGVRKGSEQYWHLYNDNIHIAPLFRALTMTDTEMVALLLEFKPSLESVDQDGMTLLHRAVQANNKKVVRLLLDAKSPLDVVDYNGATPRFLAEAAENKEMVEMLLEAAAVRGVLVSGVKVPSREEMRAIARRICDGDAAAFDELVSTAKELLSEWGTDARKQLNWDRTGVASKILGEEAGKGNDHAFQALKKCLEPEYKLKSFALDGLGRAAAEGHQEALDILLDYRKLKLLENSVSFALAPAAKANQPRAVDFFVTIALDPESAKRHYYGIAWQVREVLASAADKGNEKAKDALEKFNAASANSNP